jgi:hypothetical protein
MVGAGGQGEGQADWEEEAWLPPPGHPPPYLPDILSAQPSLLLLLWLSLGRLGMH